MRFLCRAALSTALLAVAVTCHGAGAGAPVEADQLRLAQRVHDIFEAKCVECHGPDLPRPKGKFGYVLDLKRVAENSDYIIPREPERSELYVMVRNEEMPGEGANGPALTSEEKDIVKQWIEAGAPPELRHSDIAARLAAEPPKLVMPLWKRTIRWIGRFHPVSTHFPVALMLVAVIAEALAWWTKEDAWLITVRFLVILAALGAVAAAALGWVNAAFTSYTGQLAPVLRWHRYLGTATSIWIIFCAGLLVIRQSDEASRRRRVFRAALLLGAALVALSGFLGSLLIYGIDHYAWD